MICVCRLILVKLENLCLENVLWYLQTFFGLCMCRLSVEMVMVDDKDDQD